MSEHSAILRHVRYVATENPLTLGAFALFTAFVALAAVTRSGDLALERLEPGPQMFGLDRLPDIAQ